MRSVILALPVALIAAFGAPALAKPPADPWRTEGLLKLEALVPARVGRLFKNAVLDVKNPSEYCVDRTRSSTHGLDGPEEPAKPPTKPAKVGLYRGAAWRADRVNVFGLDKQLEDTWAGEVVIVYGESRPNLFSKLTYAGPCPAAYARVDPAQLRQDMTSDECGFDIGHSAQSRLAQLPYLEGKAAFRVELWELERIDGKPRRLILKNPFDRPLDALAFRWHFERSGGKPSPKYVAAKLVLPPGGRQVLELPATITVDESKRGRFELEGFELEGLLGETTFSVSVWFPD